MGIQEINRLVDEINELTIDLERERRTTFTPGLRVAYYHGRKKVIVLIVAPDDDFYCRVRNPKNSTEYRLAYSTIHSIVD